MRLITLLVLILSGDLRVQARDSTSSGETPRRKARALESSVRQIIKSTSDYYPQKSISIPEGVSTGTDDLSEGSTEYTSRLYHPKDGPQAEKRENEDMGRGGDEFFTLERYYPQSIEKHPEDPYYDLSEVLLKFQSQLRDKGSQYEENDIPQTDAPLVSKLPQEFLKKFMGSPKEPPPKELRGSPRKLDEGKVSQFLKEQDQKEAPEQVKERQTAFKNRISAFNKEFKKIRGLDDDLPESEHQGAKVGVRKSVLDRLKGNVEEGSAGVSEQPTFVEPVLPKQPCPSEINPETAKKVVEEALAKAKTSSAEIKRIYKLYYPCLFKKEVRNEVRLAMINNLRQLRIISLSLFGAALRSREPLCRKLFPYTPMVWLRPKHFDKEPTLRPLCEFCPLSASCKEACKTFFPSSTTPSSESSSPPPSPLNPEV